MASRSRAGLGLMLGSVICFVVMSAFVKVVREAGMSTAEVMVWRMGPGIAVVVLQMRLRRVSLRLQRPREVLLRATFGGLAMAFYFWALQQLTLLQFSVIGLSQPALVAVLAVPLLHERLRGSAALALPLAMAGAALVVLPDEIFTGSAQAAFRGIPTAAALAALACALCSALAHTFVRRATRPEAPDGSPPEAPETVVLYFSVLVTLGAAIVGLADGDLVGPPTTMPFGPALALLLAMSTAGVVGQLLLSAAYARAHAPATAMVGYARIPLGFAADVLLWGAIAGISGLLGAVLVLVAGILLLRGENAGNAEIGDGHAGRGRA